MVDGNTELIAKFHEAVFLATRDINPMRLEKRHDGKVLFIYQNTPEIRKYITEMKCDLTIQKWIACEIGVRSREREFRENSL